MKCVIERCENDRAVSKHELCYAHSNEFTKTMRSLMRDGLWPLEAKLQDQVYRNWIAKLNDERSSSEETEWP